MARPTKQTPERVQAILASLRIGNTRTATCRSVEVSLDTFARWCDDPEFRGQVEKAESDAESRFLAQVAKAAQTSWQAAAWWLERRRPGDYRQQSGVQLTGADGGPVETKTVTEGMNDHERAALRRLLDEALKVKA